MRMLSALPLVFVLLFSSSCAIFVDEYQVNQRKVIAYLLEDLPLPDDADIIKVPSVLLGTGNAISGRIVLESAFSPAENLIFYGNQTLTTGWQLISSKVGEEITLVYFKSGRYATMELNQAEALEGLLQVQLVLILLSPLSIPTQFLIKIHMMI